MEKVNTEALLITVPIENWVEQANKIKNLQKYKVYRYIY